MNRVCIRTCSCTCITHSAWAGVEIKNIEVKKLKIALRREIKYLRWDNAGNQPLATWDKKTPLREINDLRRGQPGTIRDKLRGLELNEIISVAGMVISRQLLLRAALLDFSAGAGVGLAN